MENLDEQEEKEKTVAGIKGKKKGKEKEARPLYGKPPNNFFAAQFRLSRKMPAIQQL